MVRSAGNKLDMKILLVEDSPEARDLIEGMLNNLEVAEIVTAEDGAETRGAYVATGRITKPFTVDALRKKLVPMSRLIAHRRHRAVPAA